MFVFLTIVVIISKAEKLIKLTLQRVQKVYKSKHILIVLDVLVFSINTKGTK